jgi:hypothetical protein
MFRRATSLAGSLLIAASFAACTDTTVPGTPRSLTPDAADASKGPPGPTDPTATFTIPLSDAGLSIRSDHLYSDGTNSLYADGTCNVAAKIFATTQLSSNPSGDATLNTGTGGGKCSRHITVVFPDGSSESEGTFMNLREIENTIYSIPIGATVERQLHIGTDQTPSSNSRCGGFVFGYGVANNIGAGSDSVLVTRIDASTWHAYSQPAPHNQAYCKNNGQLYAMNVDISVVSSRALP